MYTNQPYPQNSGPNYPNQAPHQCTMKRSVPVVAVGIDLGTTNSCVGIYRNRRVDILPDSEGNRVTPSYVTFYDDGENGQVVGQPALDQKLERMQNTIYDSKRMLGRPSKAYYTTSFPATGLSNLENLPAGGSFCLYTQKDATDSRSSPRCPITHVVITVPAYFGQAQKDETIEAARIAGLPQKPYLKLVTEPAAAAFAYRLDALEHDGYTILVFDLGGGTFDVTIVQVNKQDFTVLNLDGDSNLGGRDFDNALFEVCNQKILEQHKKDCSADSFLKQKLLVKVEELKKSLSACPEEDLDLSEMFPDLQPPEPTEEESDDDVDDPRFLRITQKDFENGCRDLADQTITITNRLLQNTINEKTKQPFKAAELDMVLLVGGSTRIPMIQKRLESIFGKEKITYRLNADEAVASGAAIRAALLAIQSRIEDKNNSQECVKSDVLVPSVTISEEDNEDEFYEGIRPTIENNTYLGQLRFEYPERIIMINTAQVILSVTLDADGILSASAKYKKEESVQIVIDYGGVKCDDECAGAMLDTAKQFEQLDQCERNRRRALTRLESALEFMKHVVAYSRKYIYTADEVQEKREACEECEKWIKQNPKASLQQYEHQLEKFFKSSDFFNKVWRANNRVQQSYCSPVKTKKRKTFGSENQNGMYDTSGSSDEFPKMI
uniref:Uncharacterized protein n=1 Tax=Ditylenchus dipsaci TaxID=166011 RepID=A0A915EA31_9BILA